MAAPRILTLGVVLLAPAILAAGGERSRSPLPTATPQVAPQRTEAMPTSTVPPHEERPPAPDFAQEPLLQGASAYNVRWQSINGGGKGQVTNATHRVSHSVAQAAIGSTTSATHRIRAGFWHGLLESGDCAITMTGDVNLSGSLTSADIIYLVNHVFKGGSAPQPCSAAGDVNCNGSVTSADVISMVNHVFKGGPVPCDGCTSTLAAGC